MSDLELEQKILDNQKLVYFAVNRYFPDFRGDEDIIQCGMIGLWKACISFDEAKSKFSTYATRCILNAVRYELRSRSREWKKGYVASLDEVVDHDDESGCDIVLGEILPRIEEGYTVVDYDLRFLGKKINDRNRRVFALYLNGFSASEIARMFGFTRAWASKVIQDIQKIMRKELFLGRSV